MSPNLAMPERSGACLEMWLADIETGVEYVRAPMPPRCDGMVLERVVRGETAAWSNAGLREGFLASTRRAFRYGGLRPADNYLAGICRRRWGLNPPRQRPCFVGVRASRAFRSDGIRRGVTK